MVLRAMFGVAVVSAAMAFSPNVYWVVGLRGAQGLFSGTMAAASAMVSANTPRDKIPFSMGLLTVAMYAGNTLGPFLGGVIANMVGYRNCFHVIATVYLAGGLAVLFFTNEKFVAEFKGWGSTLGGTRPPVHFPGDTTVARGLLRSFDRAIGPDARIASDY